MFGKTLLIPRGQELVNITQIPEGSNIPQYAIGILDRRDGAPRKRKRLTHLTPEEKIQRRKLKNRVAAQSARDRKKQKMEELEENNDKLLTQSLQLLKMNKLLQSQLARCYDKLEEMNKRFGTNEKFDLKDLNMSNLEDSLLTFGPLNNELDIPECAMSPDPSSDENDTISTSSSSYLYPAVNSPNCDVKQASDWLSVDTATVNVMNNSSNDCCDSNEYVSSKPAVLMSMETPQQKDTPIYSKNHNKQSSYCDNIHLKVVKTEPLTPPSQNNMLGLQQHYKMVDNKLQHISSYQKDVKPIIHNCSNWSNLRLKKSTSMRL